MTTYVSLINWTEQGIKNFRDTTQRADEFSKLVQSSGGRVRELLWTVGEYDIVCVADFPDEEAGVAGRSSVADGICRWQCWPGSCSVTDTAVAGATEAALPLNSRTPAVAIAPGLLLARG